MKQENLIRRKGRQAALQTLYQLDVREWDESGVSISGEQDLEALTFARTLVDGVTASREELDRKIGEAAKNWEIHRMPVIDRNILRVALCEMELEGGAPGPVVIDEALELAKRFGDEKSPKFVNGVLDRIYKNSAEKE